VNLEWNGQEHVPVTRDKVWAFITDPSAIATCVPDVVETKIHDARSFDAVVAVAVGPVRGKFKFKIALDPLPDGNHLNMKISGGGLGSVVDLIAGADLKDNGDATTTLDWKGSASMRGPVATIGGRVIDAQAKRVIITTFSNITARLTEAATTPT